MQEMQEKIYAELPQSTGEHRYGGGTYTEAQLRLYADDTHALRTQARPVADALRAAALAAQVPQQVAPTRATISEMVPFVDKSTADPVEKARRYLTAMGDNHLHSTYFFDDGFPKQESASDALATLAILEQLAAPQQEVPTVGDDLRDRLVAIGAAIADQDDRSAQAMLREILAAPQQEVQEPVVAAVFDKQLGRPVLVEGAPLLKHGQPLYTAQPAPKQEVQERIPDAWTNLLAYVLQGDMHNRLTPRVVDIAYSAFMLAKQPNTEDGGASDWFNDTKPAVTKMIEKLRKDLIEDFAAQPAPSGDAAKDALKALEDIFKEVK